MAQINIVNGSGSSNLPNGNYNVSVESNGYDNTSISPSTVAIVEGTDEYSFTIEATGTLTLHVSEEGTQDGKSIAGATFARCDSLGNQYGDVITSNSEGKAVFNYVPYASSNPPIIYYKQLSSDGTHDFNNTLLNTTLTNETATLEIQNALAASRNIKLTDAHYSDLNIDSATMTLQ